MCIHVRDRPGPSPSIWMYYLPNLGTKRVQFFTCNIYHLAALVVSTAVERDVNK